VPRRRLARRQPDLALRTCDARQRIDQEQHRRATPIAKPLGDRRRDVHRAQPHERRRIAGRADRDDSPARTGKLVFQQLAELAPALADLAEHDHVGLRAARDLPEQRRLADARRREQPDALAAAERQHRIDRAHASWLRCRDRRPRQRRRRGSIDEPGLTRERRAAVDGLADAVEHAPEQVVTTQDRERRAGAPDRARRRDARELAERDQHGLLAAKPDDLGGERCAVPAVDLHDLTERDARHGRAHDEPGHFIDPALAVGGIHRGVDLGHHRAVDHVARSLWLVRPDRGVIAARRRALGLDARLPDELVRELAGIGEQPLRLCIGGLDDLASSRAGRLLVGRNHAPCFHTTTLSRGGGDLTAA